MICVYSIQVKADPDNRAKLRRQAHGFTREGIRTGTTYARLLAAIKIRRPLERWREVAHHVNDDSLDDRFENLAVLTYQHHTWVHRNGDDVALYEVAA